METAVLLCVSTSRFSMVMPMIPFMVALSMFFTLYSGPPDWWGTPSYGLYHFLGTLYLLFDGFHKVILEFRSNAFDSLVRSPTILSSLTPNVIVSTDMKFNPKHSWWCLLLGIFKGTIAAVQAK